MNARATATSESVGSILAANKEELARGFGVSEIGVFGSVATGTAKEESDMDVLVSFFKPVGFIAFMRLERRLQELLVGTTCPASFRQSGTSDPIRS